MLPSTAPPQHRLYSTVLFALETRAHRYVDATSATAIQNGVTPLQIERLQKAKDKAVAQLAKRWEREDATSVTRVLIRYGDELLSGLEELLAALRSCMETEHSAGRLNPYKLQRLNSDALDLAELRTSMALLNPVHLAAADHFTSATAEARFFGFWEGVGKLSDEQTKALARVKLLYSELDATWRAYFSSPSAATFESYTTAAQALHIDGSPLVDPSIDELIRPPAEAVARTESLLDVLMAKSLVAESIG